ncbi:PTS sugar transporter subunit IIA [Parvularcula dongshanensis]|uniref:PTS system mannose-specific IIA component n=1 Tax=Parvularcula dongshanensis TaxID=1173995 RepID=A0A840I105_9PROT|nr:PTS sugar transporter subunit IIA [Parvularcula dongshanensis]MBB4657961.1 PTS system mannose-specific IIA component [Parvularcula dongshanensis]
MIGIVVVSHGNLARELIAAAEHVVGPQPGMEAVCIGPDDDMEQRRADISEAARRVGGEDGAVILTDMFGGTPSNLAIAVMEKARSEVIAGVNLPMLIRVAPESFRRTADVQAAAAAAHEAGRKYVNVASWVLSGRQESA